ncbi:MAG: PepSY domain-containing protein [Novosphingobium sp.]
MKMFLLPLAIALVLPAAPALAWNGPGNEQGKARQDLRAGNVRPLREIEAKVLPTMAGAEYLGPEYDPVAQAYRLKFIRDGRVIFIDVDARTGEVIRQLR